MAHIRIQRKRVKGWKAPANTVSVCRPGKYGNPFTFRSYLISLIPLNQARPVKNEELTDDIGRDWMVDAFESLLLSDPVLLADVKQNLKGKNLMCFCPLDKRCHADILLRVANS